MIIDAEKISVSAQTQRSPILVADVTVAFGLALAPIQRAVPSPRMWHLERAVLGTWEAPLPL